MAGMTVNSLLRSKIRGEVLDDPVSLGLYATDASMFQIMPLAVVVPRDREDALAAMACCAACNVPILPRGGGTSLSGQTVARAVVIDCSKYMRRLLEVNVGERWARVEPGLVRDELNAMLKPHGLHFAPDPATSSRAAIGGMISNNSAGMRSILYGTTIHHLLEVELALSTGDVLKLGPIGPNEYEAQCARPGREGELYRGFKHLIESNRAEIVARYPKVMRRCGGYALDAFARDCPWNMAHIVSASEGTLGLILEAKINLEPLPKMRALCAPHFASLAECLRAVAPIVECGPSSVELMDGIIIDRARANLLTRNMCGFIEGEPAGVLTVEFFGETREELAGKIDRVAARLRQEKLGYACPRMLDARSIDEAWTMRENALGLMTTVKGTHKPVPFIEDAAVPLEHLPGYVEEVVAICARHGRRVSVFAHASVGLIHIRPLLDLHDRAEMEVFKAIQSEVFERVLHYRGSFSSEHGDGLVRGGFNERFFGARLYAAFRELKGLFDPAGLMNPGKIVDTPPVDQNMRFFPGYRQVFDKPMFHWREEEGFRAAVEMCTGVGACRKMAGSMCPSFKVTRDEEHSTRGRANALRLAMTGQLGPGAIASPRLIETLDLCVACKSCANECPNNVDMTRLKAEALHQHHMKYGSSPRERLFGLAPRRAAWAAGPAASLANAAMRSGAVKLALEVMFGIDRRRALPSLAQEKLTTWFRARRRKTGGRRVALFADTWSEHFETGVGRAAVEVLEAAGYEVEVVRPGCCQRPAISKGFLEDARREGTKTMRGLEPYARAGVPILMLEPSCATALTEDLPDLIDDAELGKIVRAAVLPIEDFLLDEIKAGRCKLPWRASGEQIEKVLVHGHCHQKAIYGVQGQIALLRAASLEADLIDAGCCGMAGAFGYEKTHYDISMKMGEERLFPAIRSAGPGTQIVASGFSCRHQIQHGTGAQALHPIEVVRKCM
ncbi:MAG: FAD-linked oxidase C-terminal domain-containing protein [Candidatus Sumerlaeia bacterium]